MSVTLYNDNNPHPGGFIGYRVAVMVAGDHKQGYFSTSKGSELNQHKLAHKKNATWLQQKERAQSFRSNEVLPTIRAMHSTGVRGIQYRVIDGRNRYIVQGSHNCKPFHKTFSVTEEGWVSAVTYLAQKKHLTRWKHLLNRRIEQS